MIDFSAPLAGMNAAEQSFNQTAAKIANLGGSSAGDAVDLSAAAVSMIEAKNDFAANTKAVHVEDQMMQALVNMLG